MTEGYAEVALPPPVARELSYRLPVAMASQVRPGALVLAPVGGRSMSGIVIGIEAAPPEGLDAGRLRSIEQVLDPQALSTEQVDLGRWMASYYFAPLGSALMAGLPPGLSVASKRLVRLAMTDSALALEPPEVRLVTELRNSGPLRVTALRRRLGGGPGLERSLQRLKDVGLIEIDPVLPADRTRSRDALHLRLTASGRAPHNVDPATVRAPRQLECLRHLLAGDGEASRVALLEAGFTDAILAGLEKKGLIERFQRSVLRDPLAHIDEQPVPQVQLTADQQQVLAALSAALDSRCFYPALLQGVTGSGKTLIYVNLVARCLEKRRGALVLVPEIALAWQMVRHFKAYFGDQVAVLHSQLSPGERYDTWRQLRDGSRKVVIGARSAILAPIVDLALIVVDEEHDASYKQEELESAYPLAYNARDLALVRGRRQNSVVVLGSATPSLESYWNACAGKYHLHGLPHRIDRRPLPRVEVVDMKAEPFQRKKRAIFSRVLRLKIRERLEKGEQIVLLQNRRGFAPFIRCLSCGEPVQCQSCRVSLTYHRHGPAPELRCHYCDFRSSLPPVCAACGSAELRFEGIGTQKVEDALLEQFPGIRVIRMDVDTTQWKGSHDQFVKRFRRGEADVLLGTQMVAKGLDFPEVTLVGVISADTGMHLPDFRATERSFQLLTQVAGRSGRGQRPGEVVVQTLLPDAEVLKAAARQDFVAFAETELAERRQAGFPPFGKLVLFGWRGADEQEVEKAAGQGVEVLRSAVGGELALLGPAPAPLARLRGRYRWQALLRGLSARELHATVHRSLARMREACPSSVVLTVNVDPLTMM